MKRKTPSRAFLKSAPYSPPIKTGFDETLLPPYLWEALHKPDVSLSQIQWACKQKLTPHNAKKATLELWKEEKFIAREDERLFNLLSSRQSIRSYWATGIGLRSLLFGNENAYVTILAASLGRAYFTMHSRTQCPFSGTLCSASLEELYKIEKTKNFRHRIHWLPYRVYGSVQIGLSTWRLCAYLGWRSLELERRT